MPRLKVTQANLITRLQAWNNNTGTTRQDELIFYRNEINAEEVKQRAWDAGNMIINIIPDSVEGFFKIIFVEKL